ncbi:hypothetical protein [Dactylosporangium siamense]|uniref:hypothetical protein n=1 Tax=Dactylosporangium siamense TaxID=685454 RepID=UPI002FEB9382
MSWAEIHVFQGRTYVTGTWGSSGVRVADTVGVADLGLLIRHHEHLRTERRYPWSPPVERTPWDVFCEEVAGVATRRYRPEKRVRAYQVDRRWQVDAKPEDRDAPARAVPGDLAALGAEVRRELALMQPRWPTLRQVVLLTTAARQLVVMPSIGGWSVGPARVLDLTAGGPALPDAVRAGLTDSDRDHTEAPAYEAALAAVSVKPGSIGRASVSLEELSDGTIRVTGAHTTDGEDVWGPPWLGRVDRLAEACVEAARLLRDLPPAPTTPAAAFGYKCCWLAVRDGRLDEVAAAVGLLGAQPVDWYDGVQAAYDEQVFVSPPTAGWVFVVGAVLSFDGLAVADLSARLGTEVQFFGTHRGSEYHEWALATGGRLVRHLRCDGTLEQQGQPTAVETDLGVPAMTEDDWDIDEDTVMRVAAAWSIDPTTLQQVESTAPAGVAGHVAAG